jgi:hypothetical protein
MRRLIFAAAAALLGCGGSATDPTDAINFDGTYVATSSAPVNSATSPLVSSRMDFGPGGRTFTRTDVVALPNGTERTATQSYGCRGTRRTAWRTAPYPSGGVYDEDGATTADGFTLRRRLWLSSQTSGPSVLVDVRYGRR